MSAGTMTWINITDVIDFLATAPSETAIQRATLDLTAAMCAVPRHCQICTYCEEDAVFKTVSFEDVLTYAERYENTQARRIGSRGESSRRQFHSYPENLGARSG